jgi:hypothetical protein
MLSNQELQCIQQALANNPTSKAARKLRNKLIEHDFASKYPPFSPLSHHRQFVNRKTNKQTLQQLINAAKISEVILLDTESVTVYHRPNRPGLIQLQLIPNESTPIVVIIEVHHLPPQHSNEFILMQEFFRIVLNSDKTIYTWGKINELIPFTRFNLFDANQIKLPTEEDLQSLFKQYWQACHKHKSTTDCICEDCLGKEPNQPWKLLDAVAYQLHEWLDKRHTCSSFNIGLDPQLRRLSTGQLKYRTILTNYAANDVLAMEKLMIDIQEKPPPPTTTTIMTNHPEEVAETQDEETTGTIDQVPFVLLLHPSSPVPFTQHQQHEFNFEHQYESDRQHQQHEFNFEHQYESDRQHQQHDFNFEHQYEFDRQHQQHELNFEHQYESDFQQQECESDLQHQREPTPQYQQHELNRQQHRHEYDRQQHRRHEKDEAERKAKNQDSTRRQRKRHFRHEIIRRGIDPRFSITIVKEILRRYGVPYTLVHIARSKITRRHSLYIGISDPTNIRNYERRTRRLFTTDYYNEFRARHRFRR